MGVNDGICDCCDGSDEGNRMVQTSITHCQNNCTSEGIVLRAIHEQKVQAAREGLRIREESERQAAIDMKSWQDEKAKLDQELAELEQERSHATERRQQLETKSGAASSHPASLGRAS